LLANNAFTRVIENPLEFRNAALILSVLAVVVLGIWLSVVVISRRRQPEEKPAQNLVKFFPDEDLEDRRLERVLATALFWCAVAAIAFIAYGVFEPARQSDASGAFESRSAERGAALFANNQSKAYNAEAPLQ